MTATEQEQTRLEALVRSLIDSLEMDASLEVESAENRIYFNITGPDAHLFLKHREDSIRAIAFLLQTFQKKHFPESETEIRVDADGAMLGREKELEEMALSVAERLTAPGDEYLIDPLNPYERRLVHLALVKLEHIDTESVGDGHYKRMKIKYTG
jgi:spoIIIJ-associated protein